MRRGARNIYWGPAIGTHCMQTHDGQIHWKCMPLPPHLHHSYLCPPPPPPPPPPPLPCLLPL